MAELRAGRYDSFVIRVFTHGESGQLVEGQVTHVATRRSARFTNFERVITFMLSYLSRHSASGPPE
jgi:hypothetical protein